MGLRKQVGDRPQSRYREPFRVLVVDDSAVVRKLLREILATDPEIAVVGTAGNGHLALAKIADTNPDLVTLDLEMSGSDGLETIVEIRKLYPKLPVLLFSSLTRRGAMVTLDALAAGASDYVTKPAHPTELAGELIQAELLPKIKALCAIQRGVPSGVPLAGLVARAQGRIEIVAIGASTGGSNALGDLIPSFPADFPVPIVVVQHMPPIFTRQLADRMHTMSSMKVREGEHGQRLHGGQVWIAPGGYHMAVTRKGGHGVLNLNEDPPENSCRPAVDVLFRSVAESYGPSALAVVLTGMGNDGTVGARAVRDAGGEVFAQDQASSVVWGMPGSVVAANLADRVSPLDRMASDIVGRVMWGRIHGR